MEKDKQNTTNTAAKDSVPAIKKTTWGYLIAAYGIWTLVFYSLSPLSRTEPVHMAMQAIHLCLR
jgi:hypothetical protein